jgi:hypothetical protein
VDPVRIKEFPSEKLLQVFNVASTKQPTEQLSLVLDCKQASRLEPRMTN